MLSNSPCIPTSPHLEGNFDRCIIKAYWQAVWTHIRLLLEEQSDLGPHCLLQRCFKMTCRQDGSQYLVMISILSVKKHLPKIQRWTFYERKIVTIFLPINLNMCFGCSKEPSHWDVSFEYPQHMFWMRNKENSFSIRTLIWRPVCKNMHISDNRQAAVTIYLLSKTNM